MFCQECGGKHRDTAKFCPHCGAKIEPITDEVNEVIETAPVLTEQTVIERKIAEIVADEPPVVEETAAQPLFYNETVAEKEFLPEERGDDRPGSTDERQEQSSFAASLRPSALSSDMPGQLDVSEQTGVSETAKDPYAVWRALIGENDDYYIGEFEAIVQGEPSFNWTAFFFGGALMLYRRLYGYFFKCYLPLTAFLLTGCFVLMFGLSALNPAYIMTGSVLCGLVVVYWLAVSVSAGNHFNRNYFKHIQQTIKRNNLAKTPADQLHALDYYGGTTLLPTVAVFVLTMLALLFVQYIGVALGAGSL